MTDPVKAALVECVEALRGELYMAEGGDFQLRPAVTKATRKAIAAAEKPSPPKE